MEHPLLIKTVDGEEILINEDQICSVKKSDKGVMISMSNGDRHECTNHPWLEWLADYHTSS